PVQRTCQTWLGTGERGNSLDPVELNEPAGVSVANGQLYIADTNNHRVLVSDLKTKATRELIIEGLTPPAPESEDEEDTFAGETVTAPASTVAASGPATVKIAFEFPPEHELNELAPVIYSWTNEAG